MLRLSPLERTTLTYKQLPSGEENYSSVAEILHWIDIGPILQPPTQLVSNNTTTAPITTPSHVPSMLQYVPVPTAQPPTTATQNALSPNRTGASDNHRAEKTGPANQNMTVPQRVSPRTTNIAITPELSLRTQQRVPPPAKQRVSGRARQQSPITMAPPPAQQRVSGRTRQKGSARMAQLEPPTFIPPVLPLDVVLPTWDEHFEWTKEFFHELQSEYPGMNPAEILSSQPEYPATSLHQGALMAQDGELTKRLRRPLPKRTSLPSVVPNGPLNLNPDGSDINYKKSHNGPHADHWRIADSEEMERLFVTGTIRPRLFHDIPKDRVITYVNPVCVEKTHDDGTLKFRTRLTIGGDRIKYPYSTSAVTAEMEALKLLLNCMISEDANWTTIDLTDFYLGTDLPHEEYIRIPIHLIPQDVIDFYELEQFFSANALFCSVHKTHYGLPQAGALSQQRLFQHLQDNGYFQLASTPSVFRNRSGSIRFTLVVDDFGVVWKHKSDLDHLISTLTKLYQVKVNMEGSRYLGMDIAINRQDQHATLTMPGYIEKLLQRVRPNGIKGAQTPARYQPPQFKKVGAQTATVDNSPLASIEDKKLLQSVIGTLLYYTRAVDPSICTAVHELGSVQAQPTLNDMAKMDRLLQYVSTHRNIGIRYYASNMILNMLSDASYLSRPRARSVLGFYGYLGLPNGINGPIACGSLVIKCVVASVAEAELAGGFKAAQIAVMHRRTLHDLGYPQPPTLLRMDNSVAIGLATNAINAKRSKTMDMRFFWLIDRVKQGQFIVGHIPGIWNPADHFTKALPKAKFYQFLIFIAINMDNEAKSARTKSKTITFPKE